MIYKVSYVVTGGEHPGAIVNSARKPEVGDVVQLGEMEFTVIEVMDLMPPRGEFHFLHATCTRAPARRSPEAEATALSP